MRILIVSDIHSNIIALDAVLEDARAHGPADSIWSLGDMVGYGSRPNECLDRLREYPLVVIAGNHDLGATGGISLSAFNGDAATACEWNGNRLTDANREYLKSLPSVVVEGEFTLVHASLRDPVWEYLVHEEAARGSFSLLTTQNLLVGHSHLPLMFREESDSSRGAPAIQHLGQAIHGHVINLAEPRRLIANPGSVGQPRDGDPRAAYAILDEEGGTMTHYRVAYDIAAVQRDMTDFGLPARLAGRLAYGL